VENLRKILRWANIFALPENFHLFLHFVKNIEKLEILKIIIQFFLLENVIFWRVMKDVGGVDNTKKN
jgi:hypothetical protein